MLNERLGRLTDYPFQRLTALLADVPAPADPIVMSIGEPQLAAPDFVADILARQAAGWGKYPPVAGTTEFRAAAGRWLTQRFGLPAGVVEPDRHVLPVAGTREALFLIAQVVCGSAGRPKVLLPNPFYQVYAGAAIMAGCEPVFVPATRASGFLPDFAALPAEVLDGAALAYLCTPANPQGTVASLAMLSETVALARRHGFVLAVDECYSEIYDSAPPAGALQACAAAGGGFEGVVVFHSLSKRSSLPGLRSGFVAGDPEIIAAFARLRAYGGAATPGPILAAATALWQDEAHVVATRAAYRAKLDAAERLLGGRFGFYRPEGGFFLWLEVGCGATATRALWQAGVRVLPGGYLAKEDETGFNPGDAFIRVALVHDLDTTVRALERIGQTL